jgi:hypothetical protein
VHYDRKELTSGLAGIVARANCMRRSIFSSLAVVLAATACGHSDSYTIVTTPVEPFEAGSDIRLTFNVDQNYWPTWTQDGRGILYAFVDAESVHPPAHRCLGLIAEHGGTRLWQLCDNRAVRNDSLSSYSGYALDSAGRLLLAEATAPANSFADLPRITLWLADTAAPYVRTKLLSLPQTVSGFTLTWLSEIRWTGANTFVALGQQFGSLPHCYRCECNPCPTDSIFGDGGIIVVGTITGAGATLQAVPGTDSATSYSLAENGASLVFTRHHDLRLFKVPMAGGVSVPLPIHRDVPDTAVLITGELTGGSCAGATCIVANNGIFLSDTYSTPAPSWSPCVGGPTCGIFAVFLGTGSQLQSVSLVTGDVRVIQQDSVQEIYASPQLSPLSGNLVVQRGGVWGHLQTFATAGRGNGQLHLLSGVLP